MNMHFGANKEGAFGGTHFRDIYSIVSNKWYKKNLMS